MHKKYMRVGLFLIGGLILAGGIAGLFVKNFGNESDWYTNNAAAIQKTIVDKKDIDKDGIVDGYDAYLARRQKEGTLSSEILFPVRTFVLSTNGSPLDNTEPTNSTLLEYGPGGFLMRGWQTKYQKKGHARFSCEPPMLNITFDKADSHGRRRLLFNGATTYPGYTGLEYQKVRFAGDCDLSRDYFGWDGSDGLNGNVDIQLLDYIVYKILRSFGVPTVEPVAFTNISFNTPDPRYTGKSYPYMVLQRDNEQDDQIPFTKQFNLLPDLIEDGKFDRWGGVWNENENRLLSVTVRDVINNINQTLALNPDTQIRYLLFTQFLQIDDRGTLHNEDYGHEIGATTWKTIPYGFDFGFYSCSTDPQLFSLIYQIDNLPETIRPTYQALYYKIAREIFGSEENLYKMLLAVDQFPFKVDKSLLKKYLRVAFYKYAKYVSDESFARALHQKHVPLGVVLPFSNDKEAEKAELDLLNSCKRTYEPAPALGISIGDGARLEVSSRPGSDPISAYATYAIDITATESDLHLSKTNLFRFNVLDEHDQTANGAYRYYNTYGKPDGVIDEPGPYYLLRRGSTAHFNVQTHVAIPNQRGTYYLALDRVWLGPRYGPVPVPANRTNSITIGTGEPFVSILSPSGNETFRAGSSIPVRWNSSNLSATTSLTIYLSSDARGEQKASPIARVANTGSADFSLDSISSGGTYFLNIECSLGECIKDVSKAFTVTFSQRSLGVLGDSLLSLEYDPSSGGEASLVANLSVSVGTGSQEFRIPKSGFQIGALDTSGHYGVYGPNLSVTTSGAITETPSEYVIAANGKGRFDLVARFNPRQMFAGEYYVTLSRVFSMTPNGDLLVNEIPENRTNTKVIIGEISPYITKVAPNPVILNQAPPFPIVTISGVRFSRISNTITVGNRVFQKPSSDGTTITFSPKQEGVLIGGQGLDVTDSVTGGSNIVPFNVTTSDSVGIHNVNLSSRTLKVGDTLALDILAINQTDQALSNVRISAKDEAGWGRETTVNFPPQEKKTVSFTIPVTEAQAGSNLHRLSIKINNVEVTSEQVNISGGQVSTAYYYCKVLSQAIPGNIRFRRYYYECSEKPDFTVNPASARDVCIQGDDTQCLFNEARMNSLGGLYCPQGATGFNYVTHRFNCPVAR